MTSATATSDTIETTYDLGITFEAGNSTSNPSMDEPFSEQFYNVDSQQDHTTAKTSFSVDLSPVASEALNQLNAISRLPNDWDSYGSPLLSEELYLNARKFINLFKKHFIWEAPDVVPVSGGGVQFEWQYRGRELELEFSKPFKVAYLKVFDDESMEEGAFPIENIEVEIKKLTSWLFSKK